MPCFRPRRAPPINTAARREVGALGGSKEQTLPMLETFAVSGHPAVSFGPDGHGA